MRRYLPVKIICGAWKPHPQARFLLIRSPWGRRDKDLEPLCRGSFTATRPSPLRGWFSGRILVCQTQPIEYSWLDYHIRVNNRTGNLFFKLIIIHIILINKFFHSSRMYFHMDIYFICQRLDYLHFPVEVFELTQAENDGT